MENGGMGIYQTVEKKNSSGISFLFETARSVPGSAVEVRFTSKNIIKTFPNTRDEERILEVCEEKKANYL